MQFAAHQQIELLVGATEFDIALKGDRVIALHHRVEQFVDADRLLFLEALVEVLAFEHLRDGELCGQTHERFVIEFEQPLGVVANFGLFLVENLEDLRLVGFGVGVELLAGERRAGGVASGGIADEAGAVTDEEDDGVAHVLEMLELANEHGMAQVQVGGSGIKAGLDAQRFAGLQGLFEALTQIALTNDFDRTFAEVGQLFIDRTER